MPEAPVQLRRELGLRDLVLFNVAALVSTRWIATAAHAGSGSLSLWVLAAAFFLVPCAFCVAHLSRMFPEQGGLYVWTREAFGEWHGFSCGWFYYVNNMFWIPGVLIATIGMVVASFPRLAPYAEEATYVLPLAMLLLIVIVAANYVGLRVGKWVDNFGGMAAYLIWLILAIAGVTIVLQRGPATHFQIAPNWDRGKLNFWSQMAFAMTGLELSPIMSGEIKNPRRTIFRATWISAVLVTLFYVLGTASILAFLTPAQTSQVIGLTQTGNEIAHVLGWWWVPGLIAICIVLGLGGQLGTYVGACARLPFVLGIGNLLPPAFAKLHPRYHTPYVSILLLGGGAAVLLIVSQSGGPLREAYQLTVDLSVITLFIPFIYLFAAAWKFGRRMAASAGIVVSVIAIVFSFIPTDDVHSWTGFEAKLIGGCALMFILARVFYSRYQKVTT